MLQAVDDAGHAARQGDFRVRHAVAHGVAGADAHGDARVARHLHQFIDKGHHETVEVGAGDVLQMAARHDAGLEGLPHRFQILLHRLRAGELHLFEDVVVAAADEYARFADAQIAHEAEVLLGGAYPGGDLREAQAEIAAALQRLAVLLAVNEELRLADDAVGAAQLAHQFVELDDLVGRVGVDRLLPIAEGGVGDPDLLRHVHRHAAVVEGYLGDALIIVDVAVEVRLRHVLQGVAVVLLLQQVCFRRYFQHDVCPPECLYTII